MPTTHRRTISLTLFAALLSAWLIPMAHALDTTVQASGLVEVAVPATPGAVELWVDIEADGLAPEQAVLRRDGADVPLTAGAFGLTGRLPVDGAALTLDVGLRTATSATLAITLADAAGRILHSDAATVEFTSLAEDSEPTWPPGEPCRPGKPPYGPPDKSGKPPYGPPDHRGKPCKPGKPPHGAPGKPGKPHYGPLGQNRQV